MRGAKTDLSIVKSCTDICFRDFENQLVSQVGDYSNIQLLPGQM